MKQDEHLLAGAPEGLQETRILPPLTDSFKNSWFFTVWRRDNTTQEQILVLDFVISALQDHARSLRGEKVKIEVFLRWFRVAREMQHSKGLPFDMPEALVAHLSEVQGLQPLPDKHVVKSMLMDVKTFCKSSVPEVHVKLSRVAQWRAGIDNEEDRQQFEQHKGAALTYCHTEIKKMLTQYGEFPICKWFLGILDRAIREGRHSFRVVTESWCSDALAEMIDGMEMLSWTVLANRLDTAIVEEKLTHADCQLVSFPAAEPLREALLTFLWDLTQLRVVLVSQVEQVKQVKSKLIALCVSLGIPLATQAMLMLKAEYGDDLLNVVGMNATALNLV